MTAPSFRRRSAGYADPGATAGLPFGDLLYAIGLLLAAAADIAAFVLVIQVAAPNMPDWSRYLLVAGLTATTLALAHLTGRLWRDYNARETIATRTKIVLPLLAWLLIGAVAFYIRVKAPTGDTTGSPLEPERPVEDSDSTLIRALLFLCLYFGTGAVAIFGGYLTHNPFRANYMRARFAHRRAARKVARRHPRFVGAVAVAAQQRANRDRDRDAYAAAQQVRTALVDELKRYSEVLMAQHLQDPAATDGLTGPPHVARQAWTLNGRTLVPTHPN